MAAGTSSPTSPVSRCVARAPGRVNLIGEHTDYNDGLCLAVALPCETVATVTRRDDDAVVLRSDHVGDDGRPTRWEGALDRLGPGQVDGWAAYAAGTLWALQQAGYAVPGVEVDLTSTVPVGAGLSSSAALEAAVAAAVCGLLALELDPDRRAELVAVCRRAESEVVGAPTGGLDQTAVLRADDGAAVLIDFADGSLRRVDLGLPEAGLELLVVDTRVSHALTDGGYGSRRDECAAAARALGLGSLREATPEAVEGLDDDVLRRRARHVVTENDRVRDTVAAVGDRDWDRVGALFSASHASMRDDFEISCPELDLVVETVAGTGALGARMTGGGFGGSAVVLVPAERAEATRRAVDVAFTLAGFRPPLHLDGTPSAPAAVLEAS